MMSALSFSGVSYSVYFQDNKKPATNYAIYKAINLEMLYQPILKAK